MEEEVKAQMKVIKNENASKESMDELKSKIEALKQENTEAVQEEVKEIKEEKLFKKSELLDEQKSLLEANEKLLKEMQKREYDVEFKTFKIFDKLYKFIEKEAPWGHTTAAGLIMLYHNLKEQKLEIRKAKIEGEDKWDGIVKLRSTNVSILWQMLTRMTGTGFYQARDFVEIMATIGETISTAHNKVMEDNQGIRDNHTRLAKVDDLLDSGKFEDDTLQCGCVGECKGHDEEPTEEKKDEIKE